MSVLLQRSAAVSGDVTARAERRHRRLDPGLCTECDCNGPRRVVVRTDYVLYARCDACGALAVLQKPGVTQLGEAFDVAR